VKTMAEVLAEHDDWTYLIARNAMVCRGGHCGWTKPLSEDESSRDAYRAHQADALAAAGYGPVREAQEAAWDEGYDRAESDHYGTGFWTKRLRGNPYRAAS